MDCSFCSTGQQGLNRNMTTAEIIAQVWFAARTLGGDFQNDRVISNIVFMGMGEPLANYGAVLSAIRILLDDFGFGLSKRSEEHTSELQSLMRISYAVFCLKKKTSSRNS